MCRQRPASCNLHPLKKEQLATAALTSMPFVSICFMGTKRVPRPPVRDELADLVGLQSCHLQLDSCPHSATHVRRKQLTKFTRLETTGVGNIQAGLSVIRQVESTEIYGSAVENSYTYTYIFIFIYIYIHTYCPDPYRLDLSGWWADELCCHKRFASSFVLRKLPWALCFKLGHHRFQMQKECLGFNFMELLANQQHQFLLRQRAVCGRQWQIEQR